MPDSVGPVSGASSAHLHAKQVAPGTEGGRGELNHGLTSALAVCHDRRMPNFNRTISLIRLRFEWRINHRINVNVIHVPSALRIDFWMLRPVAFEREMFARKSQHELLGETAWIATPEDVILHKLYWNEITPSDRQLQDAAGVVGVNAGAWTNHIFAVGPRN